jgi:hypothetical protein
LLIIAAAGVAAVSVAALVTWRFALHDTTTPVPVTEAVATFRDETPVVPEAPDEPDHALPAAGVYSYDTSGAEGVDALTGATHDYPATSTITVRAGSCGVVLDWTPLVERSEQRELCWLDNALVMPSYASYRRFFGQDDRRVYTCPEPVPIIFAGETTTTQCSSGSLIEDITVTPSGTSTAVVGGDPVEVDVVTLSVALDSTDDSTRGISTAELWFAVDSRALVRWAESTSTTSASPIGDVHLEEQFELNLQEPDPIR